jgi:hypothetical protein
VLVLVLSVECVPLRGIQAQLEPPHRSHPGRAPGPPFEHEDEHEHEDD